VALGCLAAPARRDPAPPGPDRRAEAARRGWGRSQGRVPTPPEDPHALLGGRAPAPWPGLSRRWPGDHAVPCAMAGPPSRPGAALATRLSPRPPGSHPPPPGPGNRAPAPVPGGRCNTQNCLHEINSEFPIVCAIFTSKKREHT
jgi:hypothetical protein